MQWYIYQYIGAVVSISQAQYSVTENTHSLEVGIVLSAITSENVIVGVNITDISANGNVK